MCAENPFAHLGNNDLLFLHQDLLDEYDRSSGRAPEEASTLRNLRLVERLMLSRNLFPESCHFV